MKKCRRCDNPVMEGHLCCEYHIQVQRQYNKDRVQKKLESKMCLFCNEPSVEGHTRCLYHLEKGNKAMRIKRATLAELHKDDSGVCKICFKNPPMEGHTCCRECVEYHREYSRKTRADKRSKGLCYACGEPTNNGNAYCIRCQGFGHSDHSGKKGSIRGRAIIRDGMACVICESKEFIMVHHIDGNGYTGDYHNDSPNNEQDNLITVCRKCHRYIHALSNRLKKIPYSERILSYALLLK